MDIIPVIDILESQVVTALKGDRNTYKKINPKLYNTTEPVEIIAHLIDIYSPRIILSLIHI